MGDAVGVIVFAGGKMLMDEKLRPRCAGYGSGDGELLDGEFRSSVGSGSRAAVGEDAGVAVVAGGKMGTDEKLVPGNDGAWSFCWPGDSAGPKSGDFRASFSAIAGLRLIHRCSAMIISQTHHSTTKFKTLSGSILPENDTESCPCYSEIPK